MKRKRGVETCKHGLRTDVTRDQRGQVLGSKRVEYACAIGQFKGPKLAEYCKAACPKYEPKEEGES